MFREAPSRVTVAFSVPAPPVRTMSPVTATVPPVKSMVEVTVRLAPALAMLMAVPEPVPMVTLPPVTLRSAVTFPPALVFTAMLRMPMVVVGVPGAALSPKFTVAVASPVPVPVRLAMVTVVTSRVPWLKDRVAVAAPVFWVRVAIVIVDAKMSAV